MRLVKCGKNIVATDCSQDERAKLQRVPGVRFLSADRAWGVPATPAFAVRLAACSTRPIEADEGLINTYYKRLEKDVPLLEWDWKTKPWEHQQRATSYAANTDVAMMHMHMGTGKTKTVLDTAHIRKHQTVLILCPKAVIGVWKRQIADHAPAAVRTLALEKGTVAARAKELSQALHSSRIPLYVIMNYEAAWRSDLAKIILDTEWDCVVFDESSKIKAAGSKVSRFCAKIRAGHRLALTGTPMPHSPLDLYGQYRALDPGIFGTSFTKFRGRYAIMGGFKKYQVVGWQREEELRRLMDSIRFEVTSDALDLPPIQTIDVPVELGTKTRKHYDQMENLFITEVDSGVVTAGNALARLLRLQQITCGFLPRPDDNAYAEQIGTEKADALTEIIEEAGGEKVVVFCRFRHDLDTIRAITGRLKLRYGEVSGKGNAMEAWMNGDVDVMGIQIQAGGMGLDGLQHTCRYAVYFSLGYSLGDYDQSVARIYRPGQELPVTIYRLVASHTVDERIVNALNAKRQVIDAILEDTQWSGDDPQQWQDRSTVSRLEGNTVGASRP